MGKKVLVVYFSLTGHIKAIAEIVQKALDADTVAIKPVKGLDPNKGMTFAWGGYQAKMKKIPELEPYECDVGNYDLVVLGSPVWAWTLSPPIRSFLKENDLTGKKVAFWMCSMGPTKKAAPRFKNALPECNLISELHLIDAKDENWDKNYSKAAEWAQALK